MHRESRSTDLCITQTGAQVCALLKPPSPCASTSGGDAAVCAQARSAAPQRPWQTWPHSHCPRCAACPMICVHAHALVLKLHVLCGLKAPGDASRVCVCVCARGMCAHGVCACVRACVSACASMCVHLCVRAHGAGEAHAQFGAGPPACIPTCTKAAMQLMQARAASSMCSTRHGNSTWHSRGNASACMRFSQACTHTHTPGAPQQHLA